MKSPRFQFRKIGQLLRRISMKPLLQKLGGLRFNSVKGMQINSVGMKLFIIFFCTVVLLSSLLGLISYNNSKNIIMDQVSTAASQSIVQAADKLDFLFKEYENSSRQIAVDQSIKADLELVNKPDVGIVEKTKAEEELRRKLDAIAGSDKRLMGIRLLSKDIVATKSYVSTGNSSIISNEKSQAKVKKIIDAKGQIVWLPTEKKGFFGTATEPTVTMGRLLRNLQNPNAEYVLLYEIKEKSLSDLLSNLQIGEGGDIRILNNDNTVVYSNNADLLEKPSFIIAGGKDSTFTTMKNEQGVDQLVVYKQLPSTGWDMIGFAPVSSFVKATNKLLYVTLVIVVVAALLAVLIGYYIVRIVGRPLVKLAKLMEEGERGNLKVRTHFKGKDEIGRLGVSFNRMMQQIAKLVDQTNVSAKEVLATAQQLSEVSKSTAITAGEVASATQEIAQGAASMAVEAEKGNMLTENIGVKMNTVVESNKSMELAADRVQQVSKQGEEYMHELVQKTNKTAQMNQVVVENSDQLKQSTSSIRKILQVMVDMTQQINILSVNATIEAARAGVAGKGFMVIADRIRELADQSKQSIEMVSGITDEIQKGIEATTVALRQAAPLFTEQMESVHEASGIFENVRGQMEDFLEQINNSTASVNELIESQQVLTETISSVSAVVEQTTASTEEVASMSSEQYLVSEKLVSLSNKLQELSDTLKKSLVMFET
ncbi:methyl-accepting chemotaxis protein [Paenibacillus sediminis]|uniref:Methyl-accepting chemotaxis protein n=1 Tax=Paenibacillus sediminis TaxID=664909 RepID=A0ABS4H3V1_9BACL|nr:methyl-accepting chemotaxis protein [Paenibacillus sediminis]MBP1936952.1 methyl-accepting chemotaxis protein [Paenibacillus sediminis]